MSKKIKKLDISLESKEESFKPNYKAKKDFKIVHNEYVREIKKGEDVSDIPQGYLLNLKTENVI